MDPAHSPTIVGAVGSPYTRKLRAVFRYRRLPHAFVQQGSPESAGLPRPKVMLMPQLVAPDADGQLVARTDTTPLIRELESVRPGERSVVPDDPALAFLDALVEDYGDEWLTKAMFHYRWAYAPDIEKAQTVLPRWYASQQSDEALAEAGRTFGERQIERLWVVGSNEKTGPIIEASYARFLDLFEDHLRHHRFVFGDRPGTADFAIYGQLTQLALFDPTAQAVTLARAGRVYAWTELVEDLSGLEPTADQWFGRDALPQTLRALLNEIGRVYPPFLLANARALEAGADRVECTIDGETWTQKPFPYQGKCLQWLRRDHAALAESDRAFVDETLAGTGLEALFSKA